MKIIYFANHSNEGSDNTEQHIKFAFEKAGHQVVLFDENNYIKNEIIAETKDADLFLFHKGGVKDGMSFMRFIELLGNVTCPKVCWYFDKIWGDREAVMENLIPYIDKLFLTDETWMRRHSYENVEVLHQGIGTENTALGEYKEELKTDIAFVGQIYGDRIEFVEKLKARYGENFRVFGNIFNRDLYNLAASTKIFIAPDSPGDDFYWSSRVYMTLGSGGFLLHPKYEGLKKQFKDKEHLVYYTDFNDMCDKIDFYLADEKKRKRIQQSGYKECVSKHNYELRCQTLLEKLSSGKTE